MSAYDQLRQTTAAGLVALVTLAIPSLAAAQPVSLKTQAGTELGLNAAYYRYEEPGVPMTEKGYNTGIDLVWTATPGDDWFMRGDGSFAYGHHDYTGSGTKDDNPYRYAEVRGTFGKDFDHDRYSLSPYLGIGFRYLHDDLRGVTSTGAVGYRRESRYLYIPVGVVHRIGLESSARLSTTLEFNYLLRGRQKSHLSDSFASLPDLTNRQDSGYGIRAGVYYEKGNGSLGPWFRYWHIDQSETAPATFTVSGTPVTVLFVEPKNETTEIGFRVGYKF